MVIVDYTVCKFYHDFHRGRRSLISYHDIHIISLILYPRYIVHFNLIPKLI